MPKKPVNKVAKKPAKKVVKKAAPMAKDIKAPKPKALGTTQYVMGVVAYLWILFLVPLLAMRDDGFVHFHAKQGLVFFLASIAVSIFTLIPIIGWIFGPILHIVLLVFWVIAIINVLMGRQWKMPLLGDWAERLDL